MATKPSDKTTSLGAALIGCIQVIGARRMAIGGLSRKQLNKIRSPHGRKKLGLSLCEGVRCCRELLDRRPEWVHMAVFNSQTSTAELQDLQKYCAEKNIPTDSLSDQDFKNLAQTENPQGILIVFAPSDGTPNAVDQVATLRDPFVLILDQVQDPGNEGTILRTAAAASLREVWLTSGSADAFAPKTIRSGMGAQFSLATRRFSSLDDAYATAIGQGYENIWLTATSGEFSCFDADFDISDSVLVIGNEARGVNHVPAEENVRTVYIPMPGSAESLNVAQATTILLFDAVRRGILPPSYLD